MDRHGSDSHDIVPFSILIEWNKLLFDIFIPRAWSHLLNTITVHFPTTHIFSAWPAAKHFTESDSAYWASFPKNVLDTVLENGAAVWLVIGQDVYKRLEDVFVASPSTSDELIQALADTGMSICCPPNHLFRMIEALSRWNHRILTPERASTALRDNFSSNLSNAPAERRATILQYCLSSDKIGNIIGLSVIPTVSGTFVSLTQQGTTAQTHTLLEAADIELFRPCDGNAIFLDELPSSVVYLFRQRAPQDLNVKWLDPNQVVTYLAQHPTRSGLNLPRTEADASAIAFLSKFWTWLDRWGNRSPLLTKLESEFVLPRVGGLKPALRSQPVFDPTEIDPALSACLSGFGVPFLSSALESGARTILTRYGFLKSATEMHALLDAMGTVGGAASDQNVQLLFRHFNRYMVDSTWYSFSERQKTAFRQLPIFPIVEYDANVLVRRRRAAVNGLKAYGVRSFELLPVLPNAVFVDVNVLDQRLLPLLNESKRSPLSDMEVLDLSVTRLDQQPKNLLARMLQHIASHQYCLTSGLQQSLRSERYAYSSHGTREAPQTLIDPSSPLHSLYANDNQRLHSLQDEEEKCIAASLSQLGLLDKTLSADNITDRIRHIASTISFDNAVKLLNIIYEHGFNCHNLTLDNSVRWLPTQKQTLVTAAECRPGKGTTSEELHLFDKMLELVHANAMVSPSLRKVLGWDGPIPVDILLRQFRDVLDHPEGDVYHRVKNIIKELSRRQRSLTTDHWSAVRLLLENRKWVPTSEHKLVEPWQAVFSSSFQGIYMVAPDLSGEGSETRDFLTKLNCLSTPSFDTVTRRLTQLAGETRSATTTSSAIATLKCAVLLGLTETQLSQLLVPDDLHHLRPVQDVLFNDVGENSLLLSQNEVCLANSSIDDALAQDLGLQRLGHKHVHLQTLGEDMGVTPATIVEKTLAQYTEKQFLPEFLANAEDAAASKLMVIINDYTPTEGNFLSPALRRLYDGHSVMVYNDSEFSNSDFEGICRTHIGGKANNPDSIGQFGLGALTMFHITECAVIYSGDKVLFLDPSKSYLPNSGGASRRASLLIPSLKYLDQVYPGHTHFLKGLDSEFFDPQACRVNGTFFFLPLRSPSSIPEGRKPLVSSFYTITEFQQTILDDFRAKAGECLLFIKVGDIEARKRTSTGSSSPLWSLTARRTQGTFDGFIETRISIDSCGPSSPKVSQEWLTVVDLLQASDMPPEVGVGSKNLRVGLAAPLSDNHRAQSKFFSMLPLAIPTTLPVHVNASFKMSSDRRQIRLDSYDNDDTRFNRWLLKMKIPPLYLALLERIAQERDNTRWWPGTREDVSPSADEDEDHISTAQEDALTSILTESFYSETHLPATLARSIFCSMYSSESFKRSDAILYSTRPPPPVQRVLDILKPRPVIKLTLPVRQHLREAGLAVIGPSFVSQLLLNNGGAEEVRGQLNDDELGRLLVWLSQGEGVHLRGLPLLYLEDETWARFETEGQVYYSSPSSSNFSKDDLLPPGRFIHQGPKMPIRLLETLFSSTIQVAELDAAGVRQLVEDKLTALDSESKASWVERFWRVYPKFPEDGLLKYIENLPLVPALSGTSFKSLTDCKESGLFTDKIDTIDGPWLVECFQDLGIDIVSLDRFPSALRDVLRHRYHSTPDTQFHRFLHCISPIVESAVQSFNSWPLDRKTEFSGWVRDKIKTKVLDKHLHTLQQLPIWWARRGWEICLRSANEVTLLPLNISLDAGRFCRTFMTADGKVSHLGLKRDTLTQLYHNLDLPHKLLPGDDETIYNDLLTPLLNLSIRDIRTIRVPNTDRVMAHCNSLFERTPFFMAAFGELSDRFILGSFDSFASRLYSRGLKRQTDLDINLFSECALAFQDECARVLQTDSPLLQQARVQRAETVFQTYCETLPLYVPSNQAGGWQSLDNIRFIPRSMLEERRYMSREIELPESIRNLPRFVSPREIVQTKYHAIAWTQRATLGLQHQPLERLLLVYPDFGKPSINEVVAHLKELSILSLSYGSAVFSDLKATYQWLDEQNPSTLQSVMAEFQESLIFLNVDDMDCDPWIWCRARQMAFETRDVGSIQRVRRFLSPFSRLLKAAGVLEAFYPELEAGDGAIPDEQDLLRIYRGGFSELRAMNQLVDVTFTPEVEDSSEAITDACRPLLSAHRAFLSVCNTHLKDRFTGGYADSQIALASDNGLLEISLPASSFAIKTALDYLYTGQALDREHPIELEDLLQTLELSGYLQIDALFHLAQREVVERRLVDPANFSDVRARATTINADVLTRWCDKYEAKNLEYIRITTEENATLN